MTKTLLVTPASRPCTNLRETAPDQTRARKAGRGDCRWWSGRVCAATTDPTPRGRRRLAVEPLQTPACAPISTGNGGPRCRSTCSICKILKHRRWQGTRGLSCASGSNPTDDTRGRWAGLVEFGRSSIRAPTARLRRRGSFVWPPGTGRESTHRRPWMRRRGSLALARSRVSPTARYDRNCPPTVAPSMPASAPTPDVRCAA
jgi:hypothetical protein